MSSDWNPEIDMPSYGQVPWQKLIDAVSVAQVGKAGCWKPDDGCYIGHAPVSMNMNSLNRIVSLFALAAPQAPAPEAGQASSEGLPDVCDGKEQDAFEAWAQAERFDMETHPLHWLFLNQKTYAARQGWQAAIRYCRQVATPTPPAQTAMQAALDGQEQAK